MILRVKFYRDLGLKDHLTKGEYKLLSMVSSRILDTLLLNFKKGETTKYENKKEIGFYVNIEKKTKEEIKDQERQLINLMLNSKPPQSLKQISNERFFHMLKRKYNNVSTSLFLKATKKSNVMQLLNGCGIMVNWKVIK